MNNNAKDLQPDTAFSFAGAIPQQPERKRSAGAGRGQWSNTLPPSLRSYLDYHSKEGRERERSPRGPKPGSKGHPLSQWEFEPNVKKCSQDGPLRSLSCAGCMEPGGGGLSGEAQTVVNTKPAATKDSEA